METERKRDLITGMDDLESRLWDSQSHGFDVIKKKSSLLLCLFDKKSEVPEISSFISVKENVGDGVPCFHFSGYCHGMLMEKENFPALAEGPIKCYSEIVNLMEAVKARCSVSEFEVDLQS